MRRFIFILLLAALAPSAFGDEPQTLVFAPVADVQIPDRFDSQSDAYVMATGKFRNGCYRWIGADIQQLPNYVTEIRSYASLSHGMCIQMIIPFQARISLGQLASGTYDLHFVMADGSYLAQQLTIQ